MLKLAEQGYLSDPPTVQLYFPQETDKYGLVVYFCARGTNKNEGHHGQDHIATENCGVELSDAKLVQMLYELNLDRARAHIPGTVNCGHYSVHLLDQQNEFHEYLFGVPLHETHQNVMNCKVTAGKTSGVVSVFEQDTSRSLVQDAPWDSFTGDRLFLSREAGSLIPATPIATKEEREKFSKEVDNYISTPGEKPDFKRLAGDWDTFVDGRKIFRKLPP